MRLRNSSVLARSCSSVSCFISGSSALMRSTSGARRFISRSLLVPKTLAINLLINAILPCRKLGGGTGLQSGEPCCALLGLSRGVLNLHANAESSDLLGLVYPGRIRDHKKVALATASDQGTTSKPLKNSLADWFVSEHGFIRAVKSFTFCHPEGL